MKKNSPENAWTDYQTAELQRLWPNFSAARIGKKLNKTRSAVCGKANRLGLLTKTTTLRKRMAASEEIKLDSFSVSRLNSLLEKYGIKDD
jgi:hypothetical protein